MTVSPAARGELGGHTRLEQSLYCSNSGACAPDHGDPDANDFSFHQSSLRFFPHYLQRRVPCSRVNGECLGVRDSASGAPATLHRCQIGRTCGRAYVIVLHCPHARMLTPGCFGSAVLTSKGPAAWVEKDLKGDRLCFRSRLRWPSTGATIIVA